MILGSGFAFFGALAVEGAFRRFRCCRLFFGVVGDTQILHLILFALVSQFDRLHLAEWPRRAWLELTLRTFGKARLVTAVKLLLGGLFGLKDLLNRQNIRMLEWFGARCGILGLQHRLPFASFRCETVPAVRGVQLAYGLDDVLQKLDVLSGSALLLRVGVCRNVPLRPLAVLGASLKGAGNRLIVADDLLGVQANSRASPRSV